MSARLRLLRSVRDDESGIVVVVAVLLGIILGVVALSLMSTVTSEVVQSNKSKVGDGAYQAADAGMNTYLSDLTQSTAFFNGYMAKGEATRTDSSGGTHTNPPANNQDAAWSSGATWTYTTPMTSDVDWWDVGNGYQYLIQVYPPSQTITTGNGGSLVRIVVTGRPKGSTDTSTWRKLETVLRLSSLADFAAFVGTDLSYASSAVTTGPIFVGEDSNGTAHNLSHAGTAKANLYAEGTVTVTGTLAAGAQKYDKNTKPKALDLLNNGQPIPFSTWSSTLSTVLAGATSGGIVLGSTDTGNSALSGQSPAYSVDAWKLVFTSDGNVTISSCKNHSGIVAGKTYVYDLWEGTTPPDCGNTQAPVAVPNNNAIYSPVPVIVSGVVKGKVTVGSNSDIIIGGNLTYNTNGQDVLGLEANGTEYVARYASAANTTTNVWAAIFAENGPLAGDPHTGSPPSGSKLNINGSIDVYGQSGSAISMSNLFSARNYVYDPNLKFVQPPFYPNLPTAYTILVQRRLK